MIMKKTIIYFTMMLLFSAYAVAQEFEPVVDIYYELNGDILNEEISLKGGEIVILNNDLTIVYNSEPSQNRSFEFDKVKQLMIDKKISVSVDDISIYNNLKVYIDKDSQLQILANNELGRVTVFNIAGNLVFQEVVKDNKATVNLTSYSQGVYVVHCGNESVKVVK